MDDLKKRITPLDLADPNAVSIWLGNFESEVDLELYMCGNVCCPSYFEEDFGLCTQIKVEEWPAVPIIYINEGECIDDINNKAEAVEIWEIVKGFFGANNWGNDFVQDAREKGFETATTAYVLFGVRYNPTLQHHALVNPNISELGTKKKLPARETSNNLTFIGTYIFE